jgi:hypothetical protein
MTQKPSPTKPERATGAARAGAIEAAGLDSSDPAHWALAIVEGVVQQEPEPYRHAPCLTSPKALRAAARSSRAQAGR